ncbi:hypothetical protein ACFVHW_04340 [Streptomyces sp. NPDC127110]|uniref:hypothetical protein n=1 Tax=Streptomyces sp. NPDC127110 TaxID=3345362 RepID=UPI0036378537
MAERLPDGLWACTTSRLTERYDDGEIRRLFVDPVNLDRNGLPLYSPASVPPDEPLPGRRVQHGENPWERRRPYLMAGPRDGMFQALLRDNSPWGPSQRAASPCLPSDSSFIAKEVALTVTGTVWLRFSGMTVAYVPAEYPTDEEAATITAFAMTRTTPSADGVTTRLR